MASKRMKPVRAWGGFVDGKLDWQTVHYGDSMLRVRAVFLTRASARRCYHDVRRVTIREAKP